MMVGSTHARKTHATILLFSWPALSPPPPSCLPETSMPTLWVDADACPRVARDIIVRAADDEIVERIQPGDLLITSDLPLAMAAIERQAKVMTTRGEALNENNIRARVQMRDFMETMRASGEHTGGPRGYSDGDRREFANALDRWLAKNR